MNRFLCFINGINTNWISFWGALLGAVISGIFAVWVFKSGEKADKIKEEKELLDFGKLYYQSINLLQKDYINLQLDFMDHFILETKQNLFMPHKLNIADGKDYMNRVTSLDIQKIHQLYFLIGIESKHLVNTINHLDFLKNQILNYQTDANNALNFTLGIASQAFEFYEAFWELNKNYPGNVSDLNQMETILIQNHAHSDKINVVKKYRQQIERKNQAMVLTYPNVRKNIIDIQEKLRQEMNLLEEKLE
jgi:hypothetical protein